MELEVYIFISFIFLKCVVYLFVLFNKFGNLIFDIFSIHGDSFDV